MPPSVNQSPSTTSFTLVVVLCLVAQLCLTLQLHGLYPTRLLCPWGFSRQDYWSGLPCPPPWDLPNPGIKPRSLALQVDSLPSDPPDQIRLDQLLSHVRLFATPWIAARQASLSITNSWSSLRLTSIESAMPSSHLILCRPLLLLPPIPPSIRVFSNESTLRMRWPKYWSFSFSIIPSKEIPGLMSFRMDWLDLLAVQGTLKSLLQHHSSKELLYLGDFQHVSGQNPSQTSMGFSDSRKWRHRCLCVT